MPQIVCAFLRAEGLDQGVKLVPESTNRSHGSLAQESFELGQGHLDRIEVGRVLRQVTQCSARSFYGFAHAGDVISREIVDDDHVVAFKRGHQALFQIGQESRAVERAIEHERRHDLVLAQGQPQR